MRLSSFVVGEAVDVLFCGRFRPGHVVSAQDTLVVVQMAASEDLLAPRGPIVVVRSVEGIRVRSPGSLASRTTIPCAPGRAAVSGQA